MAVIVEEAVVELAEDSEGDELGEEDENPVDEGVDIDEKDDDKKDDDDTKDAEEEADAEDDGADVTMVEASVPSNAVANTSVPSVPAVAPMVVATVVSS